MNCNHCSNQAKKVEFNTFSYWYCDECKVEVTEEQTIKVDDNEYPSPFYIQYPFSD